jgi:hypothetical protein
LSKLTFLIFGFDTPHNDSGRSSVALSCSIKTDHCENVEKRVGAVSLSIFAVHFSGVLINGDPQWVAPPEAQKRDKAINCINMGIMQHFLKAL